MSDDLEFRVPDKVFKEVCAARNLRVIIRSDNGTDWMRLDSSGERPQAAAAVQHVRSAPVPQPQSPRWDTGQSWRGQRW